MPSKNLQIEKHILKYSKLKKATEKYKSLIKELDHEKEELKKLFILHDLQEDGYTFTHEGENEITFKFKIFKQQRIDVSKIPKSDRSLYMSETEMWKVVLEE